MIIYDNFLSNAEKVAAEFPAFDSDAWFEYNNPIEVKKTCNNWHHFGPETYKTFQHLLSKEFTEGLESAFGVPLVADLGLVVVAAARAGRAARRTASRFCRGAGLWRGAVCARLAAGAA